MTFTYRNFVIEALTDPLGYPFTIVKGMGPDGDRVMPSTETAIEAIDALLDSEP